MQDHCTQDLTTAVVAAQDQDSQHPSMEKGGSHKPSPLTEEQAMTSGGGRISFLYGCGMQGLVDGPAPMNLCAALIGPGGLYKMDKSPHLGSGRNEGEGWG